MRNKKAIIIGSGFAGLSAGITLAHKGVEVEILEKNSHAGGRARQFMAEGFTYDMGPSWYWMPDVFEKFFNSFGYSTQDFYELKRLDPSYRIFYGQDDYIDIPANLDEFYALFESLEKGSSNILRNFLREAEYKYNISIKNLIHKPSLSILEFADLKIAKEIFHLHLFSSLSGYIKKKFKNPRIIQLLEFPSLFLGAKPQNTPALYSMMNYADICLGTWYPLGGMHKIVEGLISLCETAGVKISLDTPVDKIGIENKLAVNVHSPKGSHPADFIIGAGDYNHIEKQLIEPSYQSYTDEYWEKKTLAPSSLIYYLGINKKVPNLRHHTLFFDTSFEEHASEIYDTPQWPSNPQFYVSCPSKTDDTVAPEGMENLMILIPVAPGLEESENTRDFYYKTIIKRLEKYTGTSIEEHIIYKRSYTHKEFINDYNSFKGNAYGLANTLRQTAILKPSIRSKKVDNLYYTGQLTVPGPGVPPSLISGQIVANQILKHINY